MNPLNHFLTSFLILLILFSSKVSVWEIALFSLVFGVLIGLNHYIGHFLNKPKHHRRTWLEEPFAILLVAAPVGWLLHLINPYYFWLTVIPYATQIARDYLTWHEVCPGRRFPSGYAGQEYSRHSRKRNGIKAQKKGFPRFIFWH